MSWRDPLDRALDAAGERPGVITVTGAGVEAEVDVRAVDRIGLSVRGVRVTRAADRPVVAEAERLAREVRSLSERLRVVEADAALGGVVRSREDELRGDGFHELRVGPRTVELDRQRVVDGDREAVDWELTREQLGRLLGELA